MTTTTPTPTYVALTDAGTKHWHLGAIERAEVCYCGTRLMTPADTRKFALKVAAAERNYQTDTALDCIDCGACKRNREYRYAMGLETRPTTERAPRTSRRRANARPTTPASPAAATEAGMGESELATHTRNRRPQHRRTVTPDEAANLAADAAATPEAAERAAAPSRRRSQSRADRAHAKQEADRARRDALAASAGTTVANIEAAIAEATGEPTVTETVAAAATATRRPRRASKVTALVDSGLATDAADARAQLADMGE
jgi:hypothetical protein